MTRTAAFSLLFLLVPLAAHGGVPQGASWMTEPRGEGAPDAITCRVPQQLPGVRLRGRAVCQTNRVWAALQESRLAILPDGRTLVSTGLTSQACGSERIAGVTPLIRIGNAQTFYRCNY